MPALLAVAAITALRLLWLATNEPNLYADESQYWIWAQELRGGYYSKPPLIAWSIAASTALCGNGEGCIRLTSPLYHAGTALILGAVARRLFDDRAGFWAAVLYATLPAVFVSSTIASTDAPLLTFWAAALYAVVRLREGGGIGWWALLGTAFGAGMLAKYAMAGFLASLLLLLLLDRPMRAALGGPGPWIAAGLGLLVLAPNLLWNLRNGMATVLHVGENTNLDQGVRFNPLEAAEFLGAQFGVFGPVTFALLLGALLRRQTWTEPRLRLLALFVVPLGAVMLAQSFLSRANANWAAPIYAAGTVLVVAVALGAARRRLLGLSVALHVAAGAAIFLLPPALAAAGVELPRRLDPWMRQTGWDRLGARLSEVAAANPGLTLLFDQRRDMASLVYYMRPHPFDARIWAPGPRPRNEFQMSAPLRPGMAGPFLYVTRQRDPSHVLSRFASAERLAEIEVRTHVNAVLAYSAWRVEGFRGYRD
ncbi:MAG: glycosyltransferase family 39 protein [Acetobacteraceae bacterium]|nr:glycosyltransferase family 39 protein [Acetobacteraceae bacterium]